MGDITADQARALSAEATKHTTLTAKRVIAEAIENMARAGHYEATADINDSLFSEAERQDVLSHFTTRGFKATRSSHGTRAYYKLSWSEAEKEMAKTLNVTFPR